MRFLFLKGRTPSLCTGSVWAGRGNSGKQAGAFSNRSRGLFADPGAPGKGGARESGRRTRRRSRLRTAQRCLFLQVKGHGFCPHRGPGWAAPLTYSQQGRIHGANKTRSSFEGLRGQAGEVGWTGALMAIRDRGQDRKPGGKPCSEVSARPGGVQHPLGAKTRTDGILSCARTQGRVWSESFPEPGHTGHRGHFQEE